MKIKSVFTTFTLKALLIISCITVSFSGFTKCDAQSIVGKWKVVSVKMFLNAGGATEHQLQAQDIYEFEFKPDHTYVVTLGPESTTTGTWSVSGNQLTMIAPAEQRAGLKGRISTFSITGNKMIRTEVAEPPYNTVQSKTEITSTRM
jgi:hypothetical protein